MYIKKLAAAVGLCAWILTCLPACQNNQVQEPNPGEMEPTHFYEEVEEGLLVDAVVERPEGNATPKIYVARKPIFSKEHLYAFLEHIGDPVEEVRVDLTEDEWYNFDGVCESGGHAIALWPLDSNSYTGSMSYTRGEADKWYGAMLCRRGGDYIDPSGADDNTDLFSEPQDFSFATAEEALAAVKEALAILDVGSLELQETLYLSHEALEIAESSDLIREKNAAKGGEVYVKESWTEADDGYMFVFNCGQDGIPMLTSGWGSQTANYAPVHIEIRYNRYGITSMVVQGAVNFDEVAEEPASIVSAAEALEVAKEVAQNVVSSRDRIIDRVSLRYTAEQDGDRWLLKPCWEVAVLQKGVVHFDWKDEDLDAYAYVVVDALTGVEK